MIVVSDTSPITNLIKIGRLELLRGLFGEVVVPPEVFEELCILPAQAALLSKTDWLRVEIPQNPLLLEQLLEQLDIGEAASIVVALQLHADLLLMDERKGRRAASALGIKITGLLGIFLRAKEKGLIASVGAVIDELASQTNFRVSTRVIEEALRLSGEM